jgi:EamA domain-containing membrane protein RarD
MAEYKPSSVFGFAVNGLLIFTSMWTMIYGNKYPFVPRISGGYLIIAVLMIALPLLT